MMAGYLTLPNELKDLINLSQKDLSRLSRTSRSIRKGLLPQLYRRISLTWEAFKPSPRISAVLESILRSPSLAQMVEELHFYGKGYRRHILNHEYGRRPARENVPEYFFEGKPKADSGVTGSKPLLEEAMRSMRLSEDEWESALGGPDELDFIIAIIIVHCPNLKVLHLGVAFLHQNTFLPKVCHQFLGLGAGSSASAFTKLERVYLAQDIPDLSSDDWMDPPLAFPLSSCLFFFYLRSLDTFSVSLPDRIGYSRPPLPPSEWPTTTQPISTIRVLDLHMTRAKAATLTFILAQTPHLRRLRYNYWCHVGKQLDCAELRNALDSVSNTLTELIIAFQPYATHQPYATQADLKEIDEPSTWLIDHQGLGSLVFLSHLTNLEIALPILLSWKGDASLRLQDVLPSSLENLCLRDDLVPYWGMSWDEQRTIEAVERWLENKAWKKCTPNLRRVGLRLYHSEGEEWGAKWRNVLKDICEREGLEFWFEKKQPDYERNASHGKWEEVDNPLQYPLQNKRCTYKNI